MQLSIVALPLFVVTLVTAHPYIDPRVVEDATLTTIELAKKYGYPAEEHFVTTDDGYIIGIHRIPHGKNSNVISDKVVFLQHGLLTSSADWVLAGPEKGFAYLLADAGYDVWMGNGRGNHYSRNHTTLDPDTDHDFWKFSWHEIGALDIPVVIDYILEATGQSSLYYAGHSQGTTTYFVLTTTRPEYNEKIKAQFSLAPIAYMEHMVSPLMRVLAYWAGPIEVLLELLGIYEFTPHADIFAQIGDDVCGEGELTQDLCANFLFLLCGFDEDELDPTILPIFIGQNPAGAAVGQLIHYAQEIVSGYFRQYDHAENNTVVYGTDTPPNYDLSLITAPTYLFYSDNDWFAAVEDVERLCKEMGDACIKEHVEKESFNHLDYITATHAPELIYQRVIDIMTDLDKL